MCDKTAYTRIMIFSGLVSALSAYLILGFAHNLGIIYLFVIVFGSIVSPVVYNSFILDITGLIPCGAVRVGDSSV